MHRSARSALLIATGVPLFLAAAPGPALTLEHGSDYPETIAVLIEIYHDEIRAYSAYKVYAEKAQEEGFPKIAALFRAITVSEMIHARNMRHLLEGLGEEVADEEEAAHQGQGEGAEHCVAGSRKHGSILRRTSGWRAPAQYTHTRRLR